MAGTYQQVIRCCDIVTGGGNPLDIQHVKVSFQKQKMVLTLCLDAGVASSLDSVCLNCSVLTAYCLVIVSMRVNASTLFSCLE